MIGNSRYNNSASPVKYVKDMKRECQSSHDRRNKDPSQTNQISIVSQVGQTSHVPVKLQNGIYLVMPSYSRSIKDHLKNKLNNSNVHSKDIHALSNKGLDNNYAI